MSRANDLAKLSYTELARACTKEEWRGYLWWLHDRDERHRPSGGDVGVEVAKLKIARDRAKSVSHSELAEHVATYAAERGDTELEQLCDDVLAGLTEEALLLAVVSGDPELQEAVERGRNAGWRSRRGVHDAFERATQAITGRTYAEIAAEWWTTQHERVIGEHSYAQEYMQQPAPLPDAAEPKCATPLRSFATALSSPAFGRLIKEHLDDEAARTERSLRWIMGDAEYETMRARLDKPPSGAEALLPSAIGSRFSSIAPPPGIERLREQVYRIRYNRERRMAVDCDGVSWPVDLGESG